MAHGRCHDLLEEMWHQSAEPQRGMLHGLLQCAVGMVHLLNQVGMVHLLNQVGMVHLLNQMGMVHLLNQVGMVHLLPHDMT
ncbi:unnamed protein product [Closterium sp. NIES-54]